MQRGSDSVRLIFPHIAVVGERYGFRTNKDGPMMDFLSQIPRNYSETLNQVPCSLVDQDHGFTGALDSNTSRWILEFLLMSSSPDLVVKDVWDALPPTGADSRLKKLLLLRSLQSELTTRSFTEKFLESLEVIEEIDRLDGIEITQAMKDAYCAVAVECTVRYIEACPQKNTRGLFDDAINRIWTGRVRQMMVAMTMDRPSHLLTKALMDWKDRVESARWDAEVCGRLINMNTRQNAVDKVRVYLEETWASLDPSFLELAAKLSEDKGLGSSSGDKMGDAELAAGKPNECSDKGVSESAIASDQMNISEGKLHCSTNTTEEGLAAISSEDKGLGNSSGDKMGDVELAAGKPNEGGDKGVSEYVMASDQMNISEGKLHCSTDPTEEGLAAISSEDKGLGNSSGDKMGDAELAAGKPNEGGDKGVSESVMASDQMNISEGKLHCSTNTTEEGLVGSDGSALDNAAIGMEKAPVAGGDQDSERRGKRVVSSVGGSQASSRTALSQKTSRGTQTGMLVLKHNRAVSSKHRGVKIIDAEKVGPETVINKDQSASSIQVDKLRKSPMSSSLELRALVKDPLPDVLNKSGIVISESGTKGVSHEPLENQSTVVSAPEEHTCRNHEPLENQSTVVSAPEENTCRSMVLYQPTDDVLKKQSSATCRNVRPRPRWMDRNSTAHTYEWGDDPFNDLPEGGLKRKRKKVRWSPEEEDALRAGVKKFGKGNWKTILRSFSEIFTKAGRSEVDLKDKWRNLTRSS